ncbi:C40 family peptidase [Virgibacillus necropolis]|uniref:Peptidoglycan endopeptidase n=1 Tax=Virgibacillus necropolis TaxID=163877 RepID=A0A221M9D4_9BACI|nr:LysM peptidoglycan-binding domain-containing protein [Virgibacillus necropolis]ASN04220.1 peptidoglycan endopeptidase [Virgibacillus necropolis]
MANKKIIMSVTASAFIASAFAATEAEAASYKVKSGDSLWAIAHEYNTSVAQLKSINGLSSNLIFPNQVLETDGASTGQAEEKPNTSTSTSTYTVKRGDTLSGIASRHNISLSNLMNWNNLSSSLIHPGEKFVVSKSGNTSAPAPAPSVDKNKDEQVASSSVYVVRSGDTLSGIAYRYDVTVSAIKRWNGLSSSLILVGQKLSIDGKSTSGGETVDKAEEPSSDGDYNVNKLISIAKSMLGVDYVWGGSTPAGFDCSGFIDYVYSKAGKDIPRTSSEGYFNRSYYVNNPQVGDLVFFEGTYKSGISHMGIYLGNGQFIHAGSSGVEISPVHGKYYWGKHFDSYKRFY